MLRIVAAGCVVLLLAAQASSAVFVKANNTDALNLASSWTNNAVPASADIAQWDSTLTSANSVSLGSSLEWLGLKLLNPAAPVTLNAGNTLTLDASGADLSAATQDLALNCDLTLGTNQSWPVAAGRNLLVGGSLSGTALLTLPGPGTVTLNGGTYSLGTAGAGNNALALNGGTLAMAGGTLNLGGNNGSTDGTHIQGGATFTQSGGTVNSSFYTRLGSTGTGTLVVSGGRFNNSGEILFAFSGSGSAGTLTVTNTGTVGAHFLRVGNNGSGTVNLDGGLLLADRIFCNSGQGYFYFNGGTLQVNGSPSSPWFESSVPYVYVKNGGASINTGGKDVVLAANLQAYSGSTNGLTKSGTGTLTLTGTNTYAGPTTIAAGSLVVNGRHNGTGLLTVSSGATLGGTGLVAGAVSVLDGGTIAPGLGTLTVGELRFGPNATTWLGLGSPGSSTNGLIQVNGNLTLAGQLVVDDLGGMTSNATYTAFYYTGNLTNNGLSVSAASDWQVTLDTSTPHYVKVNAVRKYAFIEIAGGDQNAVSLYTNLTAYVHGQYSGKAFWYEVRSNALNGPLMDFGAHAPASPWPFTARHLRAGTNFILVYAQDGNGSVQSNFVRYSLLLGSNTPVRPRPIPAEVWWGGLSTNSPMTNFSQWPFVQQYQDGYFFHSAGWNVTAQGPLMQQLAAGLRQFNTKYWPELGGNCPSPTTNWFQGQTNAWGGWAMGCQNNGIIWSEFTHDYHMENMEPVCQVNPTWANNDQIAWWTGDLSVAGASYPYSSGIWRDTFNGYYRLFPHIKTGHTSSPVWWGWDAYPALYGNNLAFTVTNSSGQNVAFSFTAHEIVASFVNMAAAINRPYFSFQSDCPWDYFGFNGTLSTAAQNRQKIRTYEQYLQSRGARHTLICNVSNAGSRSGGDDAQDLYYMQSSLNSLFTHQREGGRANRYLFESWYWGIPHAVVPETKSGSYCNLALTAIKYLKGIADTNGMLEQLNLTLSATNGSLASLRMQNNGDYQCLPALLALESSIPQLSTRAFTPDGREMTAAMQSAEGCVITNMLQPGAGTNFVLVTTADPALAAPTNEWLSAEAFWNPQDPLGIVRDREWFAPTLSPLGFWQSQDIGSVGVTGGVGLSSNVFAIIGSGADIWGTNDAFRFVYSSVSGDGSLTARVVSQLNTDPWAKTGVMVREALSAGSREALVAITPGQGASFQYRSVANQASALSGTLAAAAPYWVRLTRSGTNLTGYISADGLTWTQTGTIGLSGLASTLYWGMAVCAHNSTLANVAAIDSVTLSANHAPVFSTLSNRTIVAGYTLVVPASNYVTDPDYPPQTLRFSLLSTQGGATLDTNSGVFSWRPTLPQAPMVTQVRLAVTDSGSPPLSATQAFWLTVNSPLQPSFGPVGFSNGLFTCGVSGDAGPDYAILSSTNLVNWFPLTTNYSAVPPFIFTDSNYATFPRRFYRLQLGP